jgi:hypothetical protein
VLRYLQRNSGIGSRNSQRRQTDRQTDRQTVRQTDGQRENSEGNTGKLLEIILKKEDVSPSVHTRM